MSNAETPKLVTPKEAAGILGIHPETLNQWRLKRRKDLPFFKYGHRMIRYRMADLLAFIERNLSTAK